MQLGWHDLFLGTLESRASFSMYALTGFPLGSSVEEHVKSTALSEEGHPSSSYPGELSLPQRSGSQKPQSSNHFLDYSGDKLPSRNY